MRAHITLGLLGMVLLCGTPVTAEAPPSGTSAEAANEEAHAMDLSEQATDKGTNEVVFRRMFTSF